jgi:hypothetical protein
MYNAGSKTRLFSLRPSTNAVKNQARVSGPYDFAREHSSSGESQKLQYLDPIQLTSAMFDILLCISPDPSVTLRAFEEVEGVCAAILLRGTGSSREPGKLKDLISSIGGFGCFQMSSSHQMKCS